MRIGEVAEEVGVDPRTIRYYESIGLLPDPPRTHAGYRDYDPEDVERLAFVRRSAQLDLRLDEIREILALREQGERPCDYVLGVARQRVVELDQRIAQMRHARNELKHLLAQAPPAEKTDCYCQLIEHRLP